MMKRINELQKLAVQWPTSIYNKLQARVLYRTADSTLFYPFRIYLSRSDSSSRCRHDGADIFPRRRYGFCGVLLAVKYLIIGKVACLAS